MYGFGYNTVFILDKNWLRISFVSDRTQYKIKNGTLWIKSMDVWIIGSVCQWIQMQFDDF